MTHSADLQWTLVRQNSKFLQKRNNIRLSNDPFNNNGNWTKRQSGFINDKATVIKPGKNGAICLTIKKGDNNNKPKQTFVKTNFDAGVKASDVRRAVNGVRPDLGAVSFRRARKLARIHYHAGKVQAARKTRSANIKFARKAIRPKKN